MEGYCGRCGRYGHRQRDCTAKRTIDGRPLKPFSPRGQGGRARQAAPVIGEDDESYADEPREELDLEEDEPEEGETVGAVLADEEWIFAAFNPQPYANHDGMIEIMVDSGCTKSVCGPNNFPMAKLCTKGPSRIIRLANGEPIKYYGTKQVSLVTKDNQKMRINFDVADVSAPILATEAINAAGGEVVLPAQGDKWGPHIRRGQRRLGLMRRAGLVFLMATVAAGSPTEPRERPRPSQSRASGEAQPEPRERPRPRNAATNQTLAAAMAGADRGGDVLISDGAEQGDQVREEEVDLERPANTMRAPRTPTLEEREEHETLHIFKDWCRACVMGRGKKGPCKTITEHTGTPVVQVDYCFGKTQKGEKTATILCAVDDHYKRTFACWCLCKGPNDEHTLRGLRLYLRSLGFSKFIVQCDPENAMWRVIQDASAQIPGCSCRETPVASKGSNGRVERLHAYVEGMTCTWRTHLEEKYKVGIQIEHAINPWIVRHCSWTKDRYQADKADGMTAFERQFDKVYQNKMVPLGETVMYRFPGPNQCKLTGPWGMGIYCGRSVISDTHIVATRQRTYLVKTVRRFPLDDPRRYDVQLFLAMKGTPWDASAQRSAPETGLRAAKPATHTGGPSGSQASAAPQPEQRDEGGPATAKSKAEPGPEAAEAAPMTETEAAQ